MLPQSEQSPAFDVLIGRDSLSRRCHELARQISEELFGAAPPIVFAVMEGARVFARQLTQRLPGTPLYHEIRATSYGAGTVSSGKVEISGGLQVDVRGRTVLVVEDIVDTGRTYKRIEEHFFDRGAAAVEFAAMLSKPARRVVEVPLRYCGFEIDDQFVIGYGMDIAGRFRDLPDVVLYDAARDPDGDSSSG